MRNFIRFTAAFAAAFAALPAQAETPARSQAVSTAGLDLGTAQGRARLQRRVAAAVEIVCGSYAGASTAEQDEIGRCRRAALTGVETQLAAQGDRRGGTIQVAASNR